MININGLWIGTKLSTMEILSIKSHMAQNHSYHLWCYQKPENTPQGVIIEDASQILPPEDVFCYQVGPGTGSPSAFSNLFRYKFLHEIGGWWADTDVIALKTFSFSSDIVFASERNKEGGFAPATCVIKLPKGHPISNDCYKSAFNKDRAKLRWGEIGPNLLKEMICKHQLDEFVLSPDIFCPIDWFDFSHLLNESMEWPIESYSIHLWHEMWRRSGQNKDGNFVNGCIYEKLKNKFLKSDLKFL